MDKCITNLASAVLLQAAKDYCERGVSQAMKNAIIKELKSEWMLFLTDGMSESVAEELITNEKAIRIRLRRNEELN